MIDLALVAPLRNSRIARTDLEAVRRGANRLGGAAGQARQLGGMGRSHATALRDEVHVARDSRMRSTAGARCGHSGSFCATRSLSEPESFACPPWRWTKSTMRLPSIGGVLPKFKWPAPRAAAMAAPPRRRRRL